MKYREIVDGIFLDRPNRFIAHVNVNGAVETVHVKNTGRCKELLLPGAAVRLEVKGCTLEVGGIGYFPDAPTERGVKHLHELAQAQRAGYRCAVAFVIQMEGITEVRPNVDTQPEFGTALAEAKAAGVSVLFLLCHVGRDSLEIVEQREA